jgi:hypothetical protein
MLATRFAARLVGLTALVTSCGHDASGPSPSPPIPPPDLPPGVDAPTNAHGENDSLLAVGGIYLCSGAAIDVGGGDEAPAYVLTAGHCTGREHWQPNEIFVGISGTELGSFNSNDFYDTPGFVESFPTAVIEYSTMHGRDVAIVRLEATMGELRRRGVSPFVLASVRPNRGEPITVIGHPDAGPLLRSRCHQGDVHRLIEGDFFTTAVSNDCAGIKPGSSGSPVFDEVGRIVGVLSTMSGKGHPCTEDHPCDAHEPPNPDPVETVYAADVAGLQTCFPGGIFDLRSEGCILARPPLPSLVRGVERYTRSNVGGAPPRWNVTVRDDGLPYFRYKTGPAESTSCDVDEGYGDALTVATAGTISDIVGDHEDRYMLCVHGGTGADVSGAFTSLDSASVLITEVDDTPPPLPLPLQIGLGAGGVGVYIPVLLPDYARYRYRVQPAGANGCEPMPDDTLVDMSSTQLFPSGGPLRELCVAAEDSVGNIVTAQKFQLPQ